MTGISNINLTNSGTQYTSAPTVTISAPTLPAGDSARASGTLTVVDGQVTNFSLTDSGAYYLSAPEVEFQNVFNLQNLDSLAKWDSFAYQFGKDTTIDSDYGQYTNVFNFDSSEVAYGTLLKTHTGQVRTDNLLFNPTGTRIHFFYGSARGIGYADLDSNNPYDISELDSFTRVEIAGNSNPDSAGSSSRGLVTGSSRDIAWNADGTRIIFSDANDSYSFGVGTLRHHMLKQYTLSTPYDVETMSYHPTFEYDMRNDIMSAFPSIPANNKNSLDIGNFQWNGDGTKLLLYNEGNQTGTAHSYLEMGVSTPYDITSTKTFTGTAYPVRDLIKSPNGTTTNPTIKWVGFNDSGTNLYVVDGRSTFAGVSGKERTYRLNLSTPFDLSTFAFDSNNIINPSVIRQGGPDGPVYEHTSARKIYSPGSQDFLSGSATFVRTYAMGGAPATFVRNTDVKLEFWLYPDDSQKGDFLKFKGIGDSSEQDGSFNKVAINGKGLDWSFTSSDSTSSMSSLKLLKYDEWNFVQLRKTQKGSLDLHEIFINDSAGQLDSGVGTSISAREPFIKDKITLVNNSGIVGVHIDAIRLVKGSSPAPIISPPDSDRDPGDGINYDKFPVIPPQITPTITNNRVSGATVVSGGTRLLSSTPIFAAPTGTPADFAATAEAVIDSNGVVTALNIIDSGDFYTAAPTISLTAPGQPAPGQPVPGFMIGEIVNQTLADGTIIRGEVVKWSDSDKKLHLVHVGGNDGKFHTFSTSSNQRLTGLTSLASGVVTAINEDNQLSANEQNDIFDGLDFIDFSENNPFGDPE